MTAAEKIREAAAAWAEAAAYDNSHGYDQGSRWGPDYDCSSLVITAYKKAGVPLTCTYTGNMRPDMLAHGFQDVTKTVNLATGAGLLRGDVLLHEVHHTAMALGGGKLVEATGNESGGITGGRTGDQTGREICVGAYHNFGRAGWGCVLRYAGPGNVPAGATDTNVGDTYTVKKGDTLSQIAEALGVNLVELARINGISNINLIFPGQVLRIPGCASETDTQPEPGPKTVSVELPVLRKGDAGGAVMSLQALLLANGIDVGPTGMDGDFGEATWVAVCDLQRERGTTVTGEVRAAEWKALIG